MQKKSLRIFMLALAVFCGIVLIAGNENVYSQRRQVRAEDIELRRAIDDALQPTAVVDPKRITPMRDGTRNVTDVYRTKAPPPKYPTLFVRPTYNFTFSHVRTGAHRDLS